MTPREIERYRDGELTETEYESTGYALVRASRFAMSLGMSTLVAFGAVSYFGGVMSAPATRPTVTIAAGGGGAVTNQALSLPGDSAITGGAFIQIATSGTDPSRHPLNLGDTDFSIEFWMNFDSLNVAMTAAGGTICNTASYTFTNTNIFLDNDRLAASQGGFGAGLFQDTDNGNTVRMLWSVRDPAGDGYSVCSAVATKVGDSTDREYLLTWDTSNGAQTLYVDGTREGNVASSSVTGDISMALAFAAANTDPFLVIGQEKHRIVNQAYQGTIDELRFSDTIRFTGASYTARTAALGADQWTRGLFHFDSTAEADSAENQLPILDDPATWTNKLAVGSLLSFATSTASTDAIPTVIAFSDWDGAATWSDGGKWTSNQTVLNITPIAAPADFPATMDSILDYPYTSGCAGVDCGRENVQFNNGAADLAIGECVTWRWYMEVGNTFSWDNEDNHGVSWDTTSIGNGTQPWIEWKPFSGGYTLAILDDADVGKWGAGDVDLFTYDTPYMWVVQLCAASATNSRWYPALYTVAGALLYSPSDWVQQTGFGAMDGTTPITADMEGLTFAMTDMRVRATSIVGWSKGMNGNAPANGFMIRAGGVLAVEGRWTGSYLAYPITGEGS